MRVAITGANGYIGSALTAECLARGYEVVTWSRTPPTSRPLAATGQMTAHCSVDGLADASTLAGCDTLIHLAGRAHNFNAPDADAALFEWSNHQLAIAVAERARDAGIRRFIQVSTVSVHGNWSDGLVNEESPLRATTAYARSKKAAEESLGRICSNSGMGLCIVRPPLVYGARCPGNFSRLVRLVASGMPLPLRSIKARRSFIHLDNLVDFLCHLMASNEDHAGSGSGDRIPTADARSPGSMPRNPAARGGADARETP